MATENLGTLTTDLIANTGGFEAGMDRAQRALKATAKEAAYQGTQMEKLLGSIDPVTGALNRLDKQQEQLNAHFKAGRLPIDEYQRFTKILDDQKTASLNAGNAFGKMDRQMAANGQTLKQYQNNLRGIPAQFSDIVVSLQGGQKPLTVLLQQGGQLKDMFGGIGPAAKALGGYVLGLVNPFTLVAGAVAVLGVAYEQGSKEATAYKDALSLTGNTAGTTSEQLGALAQQVAASSGTVGKAAEVLAQLASSTRIPVSAFEMIAEAAVKFEAATGQAASETVKNFEKIAKDPVKASLDLNESLNYLTASTYEQIKAMQAAGDMSGAQTLAEEEYAKALTSRADSIKSNLGSIESGWESVKRAAKGAWDAVLDVGREKTYEQKMADLQEQLGNAQRLGSGARGGGNRGVAQISQDMSDLNLEETDRKRRAAAKGLYQQVQQDGVAAELAIGKIRDETQTNAQKREKEIAKYRMDLEKVRAANPNSALLDEKKIAQDIANINDKYADKKEARAKAYVEDAGTKELDQAKQQYAVLQQQASLVDEQTGKTKTLGAAQQELIKWEQELSDIKNKGTLTAAQKSLLAAADQITAQKTLNAELEKDTAARAASIVQQKQLAEFTQSIADDTARFQKALDNQVAGLGLGAEGRKRLQDDLSLQQDYADKVEKLRRDKISGKITQETYDAETGILKDALDQRLAMQQENYRKLDVARSQWQNGANAALQDYMREASDVSGQTYTLFSDSLHGIEDAFVTLATTGKLSFKSLADSIIADLARIAAKTLIVQPLLAALTSGSGGVLSGLLGSATSSSETGSADSALKILDATGKAISIAGSEFGKAVISGYTTDGVAGAFSSGAGYVSDAITSAFQSGSSAAASVLAESAASNTGFQLGGSLVSGEAGNATYATAGGASGISTANVVTAAIAGFIQGYKANGVKGGVAAAGGAVGGLYAGAQIGTSVGGPIGGAIGAVVGTIAGALFGSSIFAGQWETKNSGLELGVDSGTLQAAQFEYQKKAGGLLHSNKKRTNRTPLDPQLEKALDDSYDATVGTVLGLFDALNVQLDDGVLDGLDIASTQISTLGQTSDQIQATLVTWFTALGDAAVNAVSVATNEFGLATYSTEQLTTFVKNLYSVNTVLTNLNVGMYDVSVAGGFMAEQLSALAGGLDKLTESAATYYDKFFSDTEKSVDVLKSVGAQFGAIGVSLPATRDGFRDIVESIDITSEAGRSTLTQLLALAGNASAAYDILEARQKTYYDAFYSESENTARSVAGVTDEFKKANIALPATRDGYRALVDGIDRTTVSGNNLYNSLMALAGSADTYYKAQEAAAQASREAALSGVNLAFSALQRAVSAQQAKLTAAYNAQVSSLNDMLNTAQQNVSDLTSVASSLDTALKALRGSSDATVKMLRQQALATLASAVATVQAGGTLAGFTGLDDALSTVSGNTTDLYSSLEEFNADQDRTANTIALLNEVNGKQLSNAEQTVKTLKDTLDQLEKDYDLQTQMLQAQIDYGQAQIDALNGVDTTVMSVTDAVKAMGAAVAGAIGALAAAYANGGLTPSGGGSGGYTGSGGGAGYNDINAIFNDVLGRDASASDAAYWAGQAANLSAAQLASQIRNDAILNGELQGRATGGSVSGLTWVGENGPEIIATGRANVYSAAQSKAIMSGSGSSVAEEIQALREFTEAALYQITANTGETARNTKPLVRWDQNGLPATDTTTVWTS